MTFRLGTGKSSTFFYSVPLSSRQWSGIWHCTQSSEMDPAEIGFIRKVVIKEWGPSLRPLCCESPLKLQSHLARLAVGFLETNCKQRTQICQQHLILLFILHDIGNETMNSLLYWQRDNEPSALLATALWTLHARWCQRWWSWTTGLKW